MAEKNDRAAVNAQDGLKLAVDTAATGNYLGDPAVAEQLVRDFMSSVLSAHVAFHQDGDAEESQQRIAHLCKQYGAVFMGESDAYVAQPWNSPHRLGAFLRAAVPNVGDFDSPGEAYFDLLAREALGASMALADGGDEPTIQAGLSEVVADAIDVLLGRRAGLQDAGG